MKRPHYKDFTKSTLQLYKDSTTLYTRFVTPLYYTKLPRYKMKKRFIHFHVPQSPPKQFSQIEIHFTTFLLHFTRKIEIHPTDEIHVASVYT